MWRTPVPVSYTHLFPLYYMFAASFMPDGDITQVPPPLFPETFTMANYAELFKKPAVRWLFNSIFVSGLTTIFTLMVSSMAGYAFAKKRFFGREIIFFTLIATIMVPKQIMIVPLFKVVVSLGPVSYTHLDVYKRQECPSPAVPKV